MYREKSQNHYARNLKRFALSLFILLQAGNSYSQSRSDNIYKSILEECDCPDRVVNTDSVYSFLNAVNLEKFGYEHHIYMLKSKPFPLREIKDVSGFGYLLKHRYLNTDKSSVPEDYRKEREQLISLFASIDSTTTFTPSIVGWDISRLPEGWMLYNKSGFSLGGATSWFESHYPSKRKIFKNKKQNLAFLDGIRYAQNSTHKKMVYFSMSVPVFDKDYEYAFLFITNNSWSRNISEACAFIIYHRDPEKGWTVYLSGNKYEFKYKVLIMDALLRL